MSVGFEVRTSTVRPQLSALNCLSYSTNKTPQASGTVDMKYAVEKYGEAGKSFRFNHPGCDVYMGDQEGDVNVLLKKMLAGDFSTKEGKTTLPKPGDVDFIFGGPPCQGFSTMNRYDV